MDIHTRHKTQSNDDCNARRGSVVKPRLFIAAASFAGLTACSYFSVPNYEPPEPPIKTQWSQKSPEVSPAETIRPDWWKNFGDPYLDKLVETAIADNIDIKILAKRIGVAQATISQANATRLPTTDVAFGASFDKTSGQDFRDSYSWASALNWEIDVWGKLKKGVEAQEAEYKASEADWRAGYLALVSDVASTYFRIRQLDEQIQQQQITLRSNQQILDILQSLLNEGLMANTSVLQQGAEVSRLKQDLLELQRFRTLSENALATLLGAPAGDFPVPWGRLSGRVNLVDVPSGLPADLLSRRPDIIAAEYRVLQTHNLAGQAKLARLPTISLTGKAGNTSLELTDILKTWTFGFSPSIELPIFDPNVHARVKVSGAQAEIAKEEYRRTVIIAFEEVENALVNLSSHKNQRTEIQAQLGKLRLVTQQIRAQLREGIVSQLEVFESERSLLAAELALLQNHQLILTDTVELYKALGGGWPQEYAKESG